MRIFCALLQESAQNKTMLAVLNIWSLACLLWVATAADRNEKPNVVIMLMDDVSCGKLYPGNFQTIVSLSLGPVSLELLVFQSV